MGTTTRRITDEELDRIKSIQSQLEAKGIKISQTELTAFMTDYIVENYEDFIETILNYQNKETGDYVRLKKFLSKSHSGKETGDSVKEHDVVI